MLTCPVCGLTFKSLVSHVTFKHKLSKMEFYTQYPGVPLVGESTKRAASRSCIEAGCGSWRTGTVMSEETKAKIGLAMTGEGNPFFGRTHTGETREKMCLNHADFKGVNNPFSKAAKADPEVGKAVAQRNRESWARLKQDPARLEQVLQRMSEGHARSLANGARTGYGIGHKHGWFSDLRDGSEIYFRSSYEERFLEWCVRENRKVRPCRVVIPYTTSEGLRRNYLPDFIVDETRMVEIKPKALCAVGVNPAKFCAATAYCASKGMSFHIVTETFLDDPGANIP